MKAVLLLTLVAATPDPAAPLDLEAAIERALSNDERPALARAQAAAAAAEHRLAWSRLLPSLGISGTYRRRAFEVVREVGGQTAIFQNSNALAAQGALSSTLFDASAIPVIQSTDMTAAARDKQTEDAERRLAFETAELFYAALAADRTLAAAERRAALATQTSSDARARFDAGLVARSVLNRTRLDLAEARQTQAEARRVQRLARLALGLLVGFEPTGALVVPSAPGADVDEGARPDLEAARLLAEAAQRAAWAPWLTLVPTLGVVAELRATNETGFQGRVFNWDIAVTLSWTLFDGGARYAQADLEAARAETARLNAAALARGAQVELTRARADLTASLEVLEQANLRAGLAEDNRLEVAERFTRGLATALEAADAATSSFASKIALEQATFQVARAALAVRLAAGAWPLSAKRERPTK